MSSLLAVSASVTLALATASCEKELDFRYHDVPPMLVIEGNLNESEAVVSLTRTTPMDEPFDLSPVEGASVSVTDLGSGDVWRLPQNDAGLYTAPVAGTPGHRYLLSVTCGGEQHSAESGMLPPVAIREAAFSWIKMPYDYVAVLKVSFSDPEQTEGDRYWVRVYRNGEPYRWSAVSDATARDGRIDVVFMTTRQDLAEEGEDDILLDGDTVEVSVMPVGSEMFEYLEALTNGGSNGPRLFSGSPCLGYFVAAPAASLSLTFHPSSIPY